MNAQSTSNGRPTGTRRAAVSCAATMATVNAHIVLIHPQAPAKPLPGAACNGCGLAAPSSGGEVPDRDLVLALTPTKVEMLAERFKRVGEALGSDAKKPRYNAILTITTDQLGEAQALVERALDKIAKRWKLDEVVTNEGKPSEVYYLVKVRKSTSRDEVLTAIRGRNGKSIQAADLEIGDAGAREAVEKKQMAKEGAPE